MKQIYIDCTNGISSDMVYKALLNLGADETKIKKAVAFLDLKNRPVKSTYRGIVQRIEESNLSPQVKKNAGKIYRAIGLAESQVHGETLDTVHFHEVGRREAVEYIVGICLAMEDLCVERVTCSPLHDGKGTIRCSHGIIPVPVPAVVAMKKQGNFTFITEDVDTEMITPSGLAILIGLDAREEENPVNRGKACTIGMGTGTRNVGRSGLKIYFFEEDPSH